MGTDRSERDAGRILRCNLSRTRSANADGGGPPPRWFRKTRRRIASSLPSPRDCARSGIMRCLLGSCVRHPSPTPRNNAPSTSSGCGTHALIIGVHLIVRNHSSLGSNGIGMPGIPPPPGRLQKLGRHRRGCSLQLGAGTQIPRGVQTSFGLRMISIMPFASWIHHRPRLGGSRSSGSSGSHLLPRTEQAVLLLVFLGAEAHRVRKGVRTMKRALVALLVMLIVIAGSPFAPADFPCPNPFVPADRCPPSKLPPNPPGDP